VATSVPSASGTRTGRLRPAHELAVLHEDGYPACSSTGVVGSKEGTDDELAALDRSDRAATGHETAVSMTRSAVRSIKRGQFVIGSFFASDNTCPNCRAGYPSSCQHREFVGGAQAPLLRRPARRRHAGGHSSRSPDDLIPALLTLVGRHGHRWFAADAANVKPGKTVVVVGDGAVGSWACSPPGRWTLGGSSR